ncbi:hypothetical protein M7I_0048 [Glarea lozoyensis 74030]|uniref:Uncharacterized protein n=1 Tax=Glarea lozoyensis (strain ATCC 74030 / MF5533) TaxID=1104152 RepID=H0ECB4_GLAL7|nr:hypothetical protein M7I_0048 [Glarea lozoyensis 74030]
MVLAGYDWALKQASIPFHPAEKKSGRRLNGSLFSAKIFTILMFRKHKQEVLKASNGRL